jgi:VWFA-related protein
MANTDQVASLIQPTSLDMEASASDVDEQLYSKGTRAVQESRWADAAAAFGKVSEHRGSRTESALYWLAYAESKQAKSTLALATCGTLRKSYPKSRWLDDCGALEMEIRDRSGEPSAPHAEGDESLKLLALNSQMHQDEASALPTIERILTGSDPEAYKEQALFVLAQGKSNGAQQMLAGVAHPGVAAPASIRDNAALRARAVSLMAASGAGSLTSTASRRQIGIDVVVSDAEGKPVYGLNASDFTLMDDRQQRRIVTFHAPSEIAAKGDGGTDPLTEVLIFVDTINVPLPVFPYVRDQVIAFLKSNEGRLTHPTSVFIFDGVEARRLTPPTRDGNALADALEKADVGSRPIRRSAGEVGVLPRAQMSLGELGLLAVDEAKQPGRKMLLWIGPGWDTARFDDDWMLEQDHLRDQAPLFRKRKTMFDAIVALSTGLRQARIQLYCIKPDRMAGSGELSWFRYKLNLKGVSKEDQATSGNLGLQVLAVQSGGQAINSTSEFLSVVLARSIAESEADYFLSFETPSATHKDAYHDLKVTVNRPGVTVRTRSGYYDQQ